MNNRKKFLLAVSSALLMIGTADSKDRIENSPSVLVLMDRYAWDGVVHGLSAGDYLAVRSGPGVNYSQLDKLYLKSHVYIVGEYENWYGVVYLDENTVDCNLPSESVSFEKFKNRPYTGICRTGWVYKRWVKAIAG
jgi:hypothetical protein